PVIYDLEVTRRYLGVTIHGVPYLVLLNREYSFFFSISSSRFKFTLNRKLCSKLHDRRQTAMRSGLSNPFQSQFIHHQASPIHFDQLAKSTIQFACPYYLRLSAYLFALPEVVGGMAYR